MMGPHRRSLTDLLPRAALALTAAVLFAPATARADCATHLPNLSGFDLPFAAPHRPMNGAGESPSTPAPKPCSGPNCSQNRPPLPAPTPAPAPPGGEEWGRVAALTPAPAPTLDGLLRDESRGSLLWRAADVFHPPRSSSSPV